MAIVKADGIAKCFRIYRRPSHHLKELLTFGRRKYHDAFWAVKHVDMAVERGACLGIIGENGSGKSTLLRMLAGVTRPTSGTVSVEGRVSALLELGVGFIPAFTGRENIFLSAAISGLTDAQTRERIPSIERFAEIGDFVDRPVKMYSSGMFVRLAFSVAIHLDPDVLIVDEALFVGDAFFQQRCMRRIQQMKQQGVTIVFVSHDLAAVRNLADRTIWMEHGAVRFQGKTDEVVARYLARTVTLGRKGIVEEDATRKPLEVLPNLDVPPDALSRIPPFLTHIPNIDHRYGNKKARLEGIGVFDSSGEPIRSAGQGDRVVVRISAEFLETCAKPNVGFMLRNRLGEDVTGTNVTLEGDRLPPAGSGDRLSVDFVMDLPFLQPGFYHLAPAVADGALDQYDICDWIDNAFALEILERATTYGYLRIPMSVRVNQVTPERVRTISQSPTGD